ncbi:MAG: BREX-1 system adenine-specific DNA-methyltransferase PglX [Opitutales bacterium]|nr:BREX-1 system adenine-specific DNA-methyltransferase PglX [Opitutales bacterium]
METTKLKKFAQFARRSLMEQVSAKLKLVLAENSAARRESAEAIKKLEEALKGSGKEQVIERVAYIWFNRFCALRFMDVNRYNWINIVSPADPGQFQPEILAEAKMGHIDDERVPEKTRKKILALLDGSEPSRDPQSEAYRLLVVAACNFWNTAMPFLFQHINDYTELLMPDDLLSGSSILAYTREAMTPDACKDVEVIGWLYQFYISEKKDAVFEGLKKNKKITPENIPAATQLFTPHWIVRYLVENSLGRLWMLNRPGSKLVGQMDYYIKPDQAETDFLRIGKPEEIRICDPACGSGHMLTYAFDLLYAIYEEEGYEPAEIPEKILTHNLYGIEIDERAGELAAFALTMKARGKQRRFLSKGVEPNICVLENVRFDEGELKSYMDFVGRDLFTVPLQSTLCQFEEADNFGSLIRPDVTDVDGMLKILESKNVSGELFLSVTHQKVLQALRQANYLSPKYHVVIANPPYLGKNGMNSKMGSWLKKYYPASWVDLYAAFIQRAVMLNLTGAYAGLITMQSWMFLSTFEKLRTKLLSNSSISSMIHLGPRAFDSIGGEIVSTTAFVLKAKSSNETSYYLDLTKGRSESEKQQTFSLTKMNPQRASTDVFLKIPGSPIVYWLNEAAIAVFDRSTRLDQISTPRAGMSSGDNPQFVRDWQEVSLSKVCRPPVSKAAAKNSPFKWFSYLKGGEYRKWYGNQTSIVNWSNDGADIKAFKKDRLEKGEINPNNSKCWNEEMYFLENISWSKIASNNFAVRHAGVGHIASDASNGIYAESSTLFSQMGFLNSVVCKFFLRIFAPTINVQSGDLGRLPILVVDSFDVSSSATQIAKSDWDSYETSWGFSSLPLLNSVYSQPTLKATYQKLRAQWRERTLEMQRLEEENNRIFIDAYGLQDELTPEVPLNEITLTCNPHYRYGNDKSEDKLEALLLADTVRELVSYAVGCMFGRYSLDVPGMVLANQGETVEDYLKRVPEPKFMPDEQNVIPMMEGEWFADNINIRFREFLRAAFGAEHFKENLAFVEKALGKDIRKYFLKDFYNDHVRRYKKRPIYWLFSSPKGSFNALIYMHRYRPDTASVVLNDYLREFRTKLAAEKDRLEAVSISASSSPGEKTKALKEIENIAKIIAELEEYEREVLYPLATEQVEIDLDDGVKVNYPKFGKALRKIPGLEAKED